MKYDVIVDMFYMTHKNSVDDWKEGKIKLIRKDEKGNICIQYESGKWWHYKIQDNKVIWW